MELALALQSNQRVVKQRNLFLSLTLLLSVIAAGLMVKMLCMEERIIMVPSLTQEVILSNRRVSSGYLEQMTLVFLNCLLDLSSHDVLHKRDLILKYTSQSDPGFSKRLNEYFAESAEKYKKFDLVTYFTVNNMEIDEAKNVVTANGILTSRYGKQGFETQAKSYLLQYDWSGGFLRLSEFKQVIKE